MIISEEAYLSHYGVLGMKWGVRREEERRQKNVQRFIDKGRSETQAKRMATIRMNAQDKAAKRFALMTFGAIGALYVRDMVQDARVRSASDNTYGYRKMATTNLINRAFSTLFSRARKQATGSRMDFSDPKDARFIGPMLGLPRGGPKDMLDLRFLNRD